MALWLPSSDQTVLKSFPLIRKSKFAFKTAVFSLGNLCTARTFSRVFVRGPLTMHRWKAGTCEGVVWIVSRPESAHP